MVAVVVRRIARDIQNNAAYIGGGRRLLEGACTGSGLACLRARGRLFDILFVFPRL